MSPTADRRRRLEALAAQLGEPPAAVAATLHEELTRALRQIDAGLAAEDRERVVRATHAARNSVLMLDDRPMLQGLRELDGAVGRGDAADARTSRARVEELWRDLAAELAQITGPG